MPYFLALDKKLRILQCMFAPFIKQKQPEKIFALSLFVDRAQLDC